MNSINTTIEINDEEIEVSVDFQFYPGDPGLWRYSNGDPGYPPTGPEVEIMFVTDKNGKTYEFEIPANQITRIEQECIDYCEDESNFNDY